MHHCLAEAMQPFEEEARAYRMGETAVDFWGVSGRAPNCEWVFEIDADGFFTLLTERLARL